MRMAKNTKIVSLEGPPCDRCGCPTEIREHERITEKELAKQFYYSRWYNCPNQDCKTNVITLPEFRVWNVNKRSASTTWWRRPSTATVLNGRSAILLPIILHRRPSIRMLSS